MRHYNSHSVGDMTVRKLAQPTDSKSTDPSESSNYGQ